MFLLLVAIKLYPYTTPKKQFVNSDGFEIEKVASGLGGPTCLEWASESELLICDRDGDRILLMNISDDHSYRTILTGLDNPHGVNFDGNNLYVSQAGKLSKYNVSDDWQLNNSTVTDETPVEIIAPNAINQLPNGTLIWHSGSTCNVCDEEDQRTNCCG